MEEQRKKEAEDRKQKQHSNALKFIGAGQGSIHTPLIDMVANDEVGSSGPDDTNAFHSVAMIG
jgi:hypothetical protein